MDLLDLPLELAEAIASFLIADEFENFALSCKALYRASQPYREAHNRLVRRYRRFTYQSQHSHDDNWPKCSFGLILAIAKNPSIARYIRYADFQDDPIIWLGKLKVSAERMEYIAEHGPAIYRLLQDSVYLKDAGQDPEPLYRMFTHSTNYFACATVSSVLLLTLLPNVKEIIPPRLWMNLSSFLEDDEMRLRVSILNAIVHRANDSRNSDAALAKLEVVNPMGESRAGGYQFCFSMDLLEPLLAIKSVQTFRASELVSTGSNFLRTPFEPNYEVYSGLEEIELCGSFVSSINISELLSRATKLKRFIFGYRARYGPSWDAGAFIHTIERVAGDRLEELCIYGEQNSMPSTAPVSMKGFQRLRILKLDLWTLCGPPYLNDGVDYTGLIGMTDMLKGDMQVPRLGDLLPTSIECLELGGCDNLSGCSFGCIQSLFEGYAEEKASKLPKLQSVQLRYQPQRWQPKDDGNTASIFDLLLNLGVECRPDPLPITEP